MNKIKRYVVGVDPALSHTGLVITDRGRTTRKRKVIVPPARISGIERLLFIKGEFLAFIQKYGPHLFLVIEGPSYGSKNTSSLFELGELSGILQEGLSNLKLEYIVPSPTEVKKLFSGRGNSDKAAMKKVAVHRFTGVSGYSEHEIDALAMTEYGLEFLDYLESGTSIHSSIEAMVEKILIKQQKKERPKSLKGKVIAPKFLLSSELQTFCEKFK